MLAVGDEGFRAVDDKTIAVRLRHCVGFDALQVGSGARLAHADGANTLTTGHARQVLGLLMVVAQVQDVGRGNIRVHGQVGREGQKSATRHFFDDQHRVFERRSHAAKFFRHVDTQQAVVAHLPVQRGGELAGFFPAVIVRLDGLVEEPSDVVTEQLALCRHGDPRPID